MKSRKQKQKIYKEKYGDIPTDYLERIQWMYDHFHLDINKATKIIQKRNQMLQALQFSKDFFVVLYEVPEGAHRPRARYINKSNLVSGAIQSPGYIQIYSLTGASDRQHMKRLIETQELSDFQNHLIYTPCFLEYEIFLPTPKAWNVTDTYLAELGLIRPISKPDFDNLEKKYADMYNGNIWVDDALVVSSKIDKYYSILPRVEITLRYLNMLYSKQQVASIQNKVSENEEINYFS